MAERPLLVFPRAVSVQQPRRKGFPPGLLPAPNKTGQAKRIQQQFERIQSEIREVLGDTDKVLVVETIGRLAGFQQAAEKVGMEWLAEIDADLELDDVKDLYPDADADVQKSLGKGGMRLYLAVSDSQAIKLLLRLWNQHESGKSLPRPYGAWSEFFKYLKALRLWDYKDMLHDSGILQQWREDIQVGTTEVFFEIEMHFRQNPEDRKKAESSVREYIHAHNGALLNDPVLIPEIGFHAMKAKLPTVEIERYIDEESVSADIKNILPPDHIKFCRPMSITGVKRDELPEEVVDFDPLPCEYPSPVIALLDGVPLLQHRCLDDRIIFDDPDGYTARYESPSQRQHGTAMASLICHADIKDATAGNLPRSLLRKIYVRPIMFPNQNLRNSPEEFDQWGFPEDITERALRRMFEGDEGESPAAPGVRVVNLSVGNVQKIFFREMSSWARLLDWLAWKYRVLFVVSAGNYDGGVKIENESDLAKGSIFYQNETQSLWRICSPAESINAITVGALNTDKQQPSAVPDNLVDLIADYHLPAFYSRIGSGYRAQIKPDILVSGGKLHYTRPVEGSNVFKENLEYEFQGLLHATPGTPPNLLDRKKSTSGTSNAAALASHASGHIFEVLESIRNKNSQLSPQFDALLIKALLVHSASWDSLDIEKYGVLKNRLNAHRWKRYVSKFVGYGEVDFSRVEECTENRATILGFGEMQNSQRHIFNLPFPNALVNASDIRLTATLAWFSPINPFHYAFRRAILTFEILKNHGIESKRCGSDWQQVRKGALQHEVFEIQNNTGAQNIEISIDCKADSGQSLDDPVPYGLAITLETADSIDIYNAIAESIAEIPTP